MNLQLEYLKAGLTLLGVFIGALIPAFGGWWMARRHNITSSTLEEIKDRASFRKAQQLAISEAQEASFAALDQVNVLAGRIATLLAEREMLFESNTRLRAENVILLERVKQCEARQIMLEERLTEHVRICGPKE